MFWCWRGGSPGVGSSVWHRLCCRGPFPSGHTGPSRRRAPVSPDQALWTRRTRAGASFCSVADATARLLKGKTPISLFTEERQPRAPLSPARKRRPAGIWSPGHPERSVLRAWREVPRFAEARTDGRTEAGCPQRTFESGMKHVCSIYTMGFYVFM